MTAHQYYSRPCRVSCRETPASQPTPAPKTPSVSLRRATAATAAALQDRTAQELRLLSNKRRRFWAGGGKIGLSGSSVTGGSLQVVAPLALVSPKDERVGVAKGLGLPRKDLEKLLIIKGVQLNHAWVN